MFLIYINDLPLVNNVFKMLMHADDTTNCIVILTGQNVDENTTNNDLVKTWDC